MAKRRRWLLVALLALLVLAAPFLVKNYRVFQATMVLTTALAILGLNLLAGYGGQVSLGHGAFQAIGGYAAALLIERAGWPAWTTLPVAAGSGFALGVAMGLPALRLPGQHLALATFALALAVPQLLKWKALEAATGGAQGLTLTKPEPPFAFELFGRTLDGDRWVFWIAAALTALAFWLVNNLVRSHAGRVLVALRDQPVAAAVAGVDLARYRTLAFGLSAACTSLSGALAALAVGFVSPDSYPALLSIALLVGAVVGGLASVGGALWGALFVQFVPNLAGELSTAAPWAIYGAALIACMIALPDGLAGAWRRWRARWSA